jgi:ferric-dicitrate binding protein FerR (iron transport regulator)
MINDPTYTRLRELSWRRKLTHAEEAELRAWLAAHPEAQTDWEAETGLNAAMGHLPDLPAPSNFTARVLQAVERDAAAGLHRPGWRLLPLRWLPGAAFAGSLVGAGLVCYLVIQNGERKKLADSVAAVADVSSLPSPDILADFDAIRVSNPTPTPDEHLLTALEK